MTDRIVAPLSEAYEFSSGLSKPRSEFGFGHPFLSFKDVFHNVFVPQQLGSLVNSSESERDACSIKCGDVFLTRTSEKMHELGMSCVALKDIPNATFNGFTKRLRPKEPNRIAPTYAGYFFRSPGFRKAVDALTSMSTRASLNNEMLGRLTITLPPRAEQEAIGSVLKSLDDKIELNQQTNETLEAMARAIFKDWFIDFGPMRAKMEARAPYLASDIWSLFPHRLDEDGTPVGWELGVLDDILIELETGGRPKGGVSAYSFGVPSVGAESIVGLGIYDFSKTKYVPTEFYDSMRKGHVKSRDVILYKDGGRPGAFEPHLTIFGDGFPFDKLAINEHVYRLRVRESFGQPMLYFWLSSDPLMEEMRRKGTGVAIPGLNSTQVKSLTLLKPSPTISAAFNNLAEPIVTKVLANCNEARELAQMRDLLLPRLMSGEIRVKDAERHVGEAT